MLRHCRLFRGIKRGDPVDKKRELSRRRQLEQRRISEAHKYIPPVEPTRTQALALYRALLKTAQRDLRFTDKGYFQKTVRREFETTARRTTGRVRGLMYEKGVWMLENKLGGLL